MKESVCEQVAPDLFVTFGNGTGEFTIFTLRRRSFLSVSGVRCIMEENMIHRTKTLLVGISGEELARKIGVDENAISRLRHALAVNFAHGGNRRSDWLGGSPDENEAAPASIRRFAVAGSGRQKVLIVARSGKFHLLSGTNILYEDAAAETLRQYILEHKAKSVAEDCALSRTATTRLRKHFAHG